MSIVKILFRLSIRVFCHWIYMKEQNFFDKYTDEPCNVNPDLLLDKGPANLKIYKTENMLRVRHGLLYENVEQWYNKHAYKQNVSHKVSSWHEYVFFLLSSFSENNIIGNIRSHGNPMVRPTAF